MSPHRNYTHKHRAARTIRRTGCPAVFLLPPLAVILFGFVFLFLSGKFNSPTASQVYGAGATAQPGVLAPFFSHSVQFWGASIEKWANRWDLDVNLIATVMQIESCGDPEAVSRAGAAGLFQVMPFHFIEGEDPTNPETNALRGLNYLRSSFVQADGNIRQTLAGYNGGITLIGSDETSWPAETLQYAYWGIGIYQEAQQGIDQSKTLREWLNQGGSRLCRQAGQRLGVRN